MSVKTAVLGNVRLMLTALVPDVVMTPKFDVVVLALDSTVFILICNGILPEALPAMFT